MLYEEHSVAEKVFLSKRPDFAKYLDRLSGFNLGENIGDFEDEIDFDVRDAYYFSPKCYGLFGNEKCKMKFKGVNLKRDKVGDPIMDYIKERCPDDLKKYCTTEKRIEKKLLKRGIALPDAQFKLQAYIDGVHIDEKFYTAL